MLLSSLWKLTLALYDPWIRTQRALSFSTATYRDLTEGHHENYWRGHMANNSLGYIQYMLLSTEQIPRQLRRTRKLQVGAVWMSGVHCSQGCCYTTVRHCQKYVSEVGFSRNLQPPHHNLLLESNTSPLLGQFSNSFQYWKIGNSKRETQSKNHETKSY